MMVRDFLRLHRAEGTKAHMQRDKGLADTLFTDLFQKLPGKMQPGGRCGGGSHLPGIDRLITLLVLQLRLDIGRQRHLAQTLQNLQENALVVELHHPVSVLPYLFHSGSQFPVAENNLIARLHFPPRLAQALPAFVSQVPQQQHLHRAAGGPVAQQPGRQHPGIVHHQAVSGVQIVDNIVKMLMGDFSGFPVQNHQPGGIPLFQWSLGNQFLRKLIPKIMGFQ